MNANEPIRNGLKRSILTNIIMLIMGCQSTGLFGKILLIRHSPSAGFPSE
jgi:hypothetical protein